MSKILTEGKKSEEKASVEKASDLVMEKASDLVMEKASDLVMEKASDFIFRMNAKTIIEKVLRKINLTPFPEVYFSNSCNINFNKKGI